MASRLAALSIICLALGAAPARADAVDVCAGPVSEPALVSFDPGALFVPRSACADSVDTLQTRAIFGVGDTAFSRAVDVSLFLERRWKTSVGPELKIAARLVDAVLIRGQDLSSDDLELGPVVVAIADGDDLSLWGLEGRWLADLRFEIPRTNTALDVTAIVASPALIWSARLSEPVRIHSRVALHLFSTPFTDELGSRALGALSLDATARVASWFHLAGGIEGQGLIGSDPSLDHLLVRGGLRVGGRLQGHLSVGAPFLGDQTSDAVVTAGISRAY